MTIMVYDKCLPFKSVYHFYGLIPELDLNIIPIYNLR